MRYAIVVPLYNEQDVLPELCSRLRAVVTHLHGPAEIIFVNDSSVDGTWGRKALQFEDKSIRVISLSRSFGHQAAVSPSLLRGRGCGRDPRRGPPGPAGLPARALREARRGMGRRVRHPETPEGRDPEAVVLLRLLAAPPARERRHPRSTPEISA